MDTRFLDFASTGLIVLTILIIAVAYGVGITWIFLLLEQGAILLLEAVTRWRGRREREKRRRVKWGRR